MVWLVLAAGQSSRFKGNKLLAPMQDGRPMILHTLEKIPASSSVCVVTRPDNLALIETLSAHGEPSGQSNRVTWVCPEAHLGMGHVIAWSIRTLCAALRPDWVGILLADMPFILPQTLSDLQQLAERIPPPFILTPICNGRRGHPVLFSKAQLPILETLSGDEGAGRWLNDPKLSATIVTHTVDDTGILDDIDTREQLQSYLA